MEGLRRAGICLWIRPFANGNGRTSRITSYLALMAKTCVVLPGNDIIPDQSQRDHRDYFVSQDAADAAALDDRKDVIRIDEFTSGPLAKRLASCHAEACGRSPKSDANPSIQNRGKAA